MSGVLLLFLKSKHMVIIAFFKQAVSELWFCAWDHDAFVQEESSKKCEFGMCHMNKADVRQRAQISLSVTGVQMSATKSEEYSMLLEDVCAGCILSWFVVMPWEGWPETETGLS